jgi:hypothetical protein
MPQQNIHERFIEWVSDYCSDCNIPFHGEFVRTFAEGLTKENFEQRYADCCQEHHNS